MSSPATLPATPNALPDRWVEALFLRFATFYGRHWLEQWSGVPIDDVTVSWAKGLARFEPDAIKRGIDYCEQHLKFPPTLPEFVGLCRDFRASSAPQLALPSSARGTMHPRVKAEIDRLLERQRQGGTPDRRDWARRIMKRHSQADRSLPSIALGYAHEALAIDERTPTLEELREADAERRAIQLEPQSPRAAGPCA